MAQIPVQRGELTDRVRRFTGVVGPYSGSVDELVSPVLVGADLTTPPYRLVGQQFFAHTTVTPDGSGNCYFRLTSGPTSQQILVVTSWYFSLVGLSGTYSFTLLLARDASALVAPQPLLVPEQTPQAPNNVWHYAEGQLVGQQGLPTPPAGGFANIFALQTDQQFVPLPTGPIVLEPGNALIWILSGLTASTAYINLGGQFYAGGIGGEV